MSNNIKWLWLAATSLVLAACGGDDDDDRDDSGDEPVTAAIVKVVPVSANAPLISFLVDANLEDDKAGTTPAEPQSHGQGVSLSTRRGKQEYTFRYAVPTAVGTSYKYEPVTDKFQFEVEADRRYEFYVGGEYPNGSYWVVDMPRTYEERQSQARLTLVNASTEVTALDVHLTAVDAPIDSSTLLASLDYQEADTSIRVDPGDYQVKITETGSADVLYTSAPLSLSSGTDISLAAIDNAWIKPDVTGKSPLVVSRTANNGSSLLFDTEVGADVRVIHASPDAGSLDVVVDDDFAAPFAEDLALGQATPRQTIPGGIHNLKVVPANGTTAAIDADYNLLNGVAWSVFVLRPWDDIEPLFVSENAREIDGQARLRLVFGSSATGALSVYITEVGADLSETEENEDGEQVRVYQPLGTNLTQRSVSTYTPMVPGTYDITFTRTSAAGELIKVYGPLTVTVDAGEIYTLLLRDNADMETLGHDWLDAVPAEELDDSDTADAA